VPTDPNLVKLIWIFTAILLPIIPAILLFKFLPSTGSVSGPFHGLEIKLGGAFGGYFLLVLVIYFGPRPTPPYEVWTLKGYIQDEDGTYLPPDKINMNIQPRSVDYLNDGSFEMDILVKRGQSGQVKFPTFMVDWQPAQLFGNATVHLDSASQLFGKKYNLTVSQGSREITITEPIKLQKKVQEKAYIPPAGPVPQATVLPPSVTHDSTPSPSPTP
jgi:hypothetical protein